MTRGQIIQTWRGAYKEDQAEFAARIGATKQEIEAWEQEERRPNWETMEKIAEALGVPLWVFVAGPPGDAAKALEEGVIRGYVEALAGNVTPKQAEGLVRAIVSISPDRREILFRLVDVAGAVLGGA